MVTAKKTLAKDHKQSVKKTATAVPAKSIKAAVKKLPAKKTVAPAKPAAVANKSVAPAKKVAAKSPASSAFMKELTPSAALAAVVGAKPLPRTSVVSKLWEYIKKNNLQDQANKRNVNADAKLKEVFGKSQVSMFEIAGLIGKHLK